MVSFDRKPFKLIRKWIFDLLLRKPQKKWFNLLVYLFLTWVLEKVAYIWRAIKSILDMFTIMSTASGPNFA